MLLAAALLAGACSTAPPGGTGGITIRQIEELRDLDALLPVLPDSIAAVYREYDIATFYSMKASAIESVLFLMDSLNACLPPDRRLDSLCIDHTFEHFGEAGRHGGALGISSSYFYLYENLRVLRAVVMHEYGHVFYDLLGEEKKRDVAEIWESLGRASILYLFTDGEYSCNARFGGHPYDSPSELYASTYNLLHNNIEEVDARVQYAEQSAQNTIRRLLEIVLGSDPR